MICNCGKEVIEGMWLYYTSPLKASNSFWGRALKYYKPSLALYILVKPLFFSPRKKRGGIIIIDKNKNLKPYIYFSEQVNNNGIPQEAIEW